MSADLTIQGEVVVDSAKAEASLDRVGDKATQMAGDVAGAATKAGQAIDGIGTGAEKSAQEMTRAQARMRDQIIQSTKQLQLLGKTASEKIEIKIADKGLDAAMFAPYVAELKKAEEAARAASGTLNGMGVSAAQTAAALRGVPAQFTDIVVSLQSGQQPLTVLLQQGGQLKDMFGGVGNAAKALGGYVLGLVNPFTVAAAAVGVLAYAYHQGSKEADAYQHALVMNGNVVGTTVGQMADMARAISQTTGTQGAAAAALAQMAGSGQVAAANLQHFTEVAMGLEKYAGVPIKNTVQDLAKLADEPLKASVKLNEQYHYLSTSVYEHIKALDEQGRKEEAAALAQQAYASAFEARANQLKGSLGTLERAWNSIAGGAKKAWDAMLNIGREETAQQKLDAIGQRIAALRQTQDSGGYAETGGGAALGRGNVGSQARDRELQALLAQQAVLQENMRIERRGAEAQAASAKQTQARTEWDEAGLKFLSKREQMERELTKERNLGVAAGKTEEQIQERLAQVREKYKESGAAGTGQNEVAQIRAKVIEQTRYLELLKTQGAEADKLTEGEKLVIKIKEELKTSISGVARAQKERALAEAEALARVDQQVDAEKKRIKGLEDAKNAYDKLVDATHQEALSIGKQADELEAANEVWGKGKTAIEEYRLALIKAKLAEVEGGSDSSYRPDYVAMERLKLQEQERKVAASRIRDYKELAQKQQEWARQVAEESVLYQDEVALLGLTAREREKVVAVRKVEMELEKKIAEIKRSSMDEDKKTDLIAAAQATAEQAKATALAKVNLNEMLDIVNSVDRTAQQVWTNVFHGGSDAFKKLGDTLKASVLDLLYQLTIKKWVVSVTASIVGTLTGGATNAALQAATGGSNLLGTASNLSSLYSMATGNSVLGNAASTVGGWLGLGGTAATGLGLSSTAAAAGMWGSTAAAGTGLGLTAGSAGLGLTAGSAGAGAIGAGLGTGAAAAGGTTAAGAGITGALASVPVYGWIAAAAAVILGSVLGRSTEKRGDGLMGTLGEDGGVHNLDLMRRGGSLFSGPKWFAEDRGVSALDAGLQDAYKQQRAALLGMGDALGLATDGVKNFTVTLGTDLIGDSNVRGLRLDGLSDQEVKDKITAALASASNEIAQQLIGSFDRATSTYKPSEFARDGENAIATLTRLSTSLTTVNGAFESMNRTMFQASLAGANMASSLADLLGGLDNFKQISASYFQNFYTAAEQRDAVQRELERQFSSLNLTLPDIDASNARDQFRAIANSLDLTTEAGRNTWAALMQLSGTFASVTTSADEAAQAAAQAEQERQQAAQRAAEEAARAAADAQKRILQAQRDALNQQIDLIRESLSSLSGVFDLVHNAARDLFGQVDGAAAMQATAGRTFITQALAALKTTGYLPDVEKLRDAITAARGGLDGGSYASTAQQDYDRLVLANQLSAMEKIVGPQKTAAEKQLEMMKAQIASIDQTTQAVNGTTSAVYNLNASLSTAVKSDAIKSAFSSFSDDPLRVAKISLGAGWSMADVASAWGQTPQQLQGYFANFGITSFGDAGQLSAIEQRYAAIKNTLGSYTADPQATYQTARSRGWTQYDIAGAYRQHPSVVWDFFDKLGIPRFAVGTNYVPKDMLAQIHEGEAIVPKAFNPWAGAGAGGNSDRLVQALIEEVRALRAQVADLLAAQDEGNNNTGKFASQFDNWTMGGAGSAPVHAVEVA